MDAARRVKRREPCQTGRAPCVLKDIESQHQASGPCQDASRRDLPVWMQRQVRLDFGVKIEHERQRTSLEHVGHLGVCLGVT